MSKCYNIKYIFVWICQYNDVYYVLSNTGDYLEDFDINVCVKDGECGICSHQPGPVAQGYSKEIYCDAPVLGNMIIIEMTHAGRLQICEVEIFAVPENGE